MTKPMKNQSSNLSQPIDKLREEVEQLLVDYFAFGGNPIRVQATKRFKSLRNNILALVEAEIVEAERSKNDAYKERDMLVSGLSKVFPAYLARHSDDDKEWEDDWRWIVYIDLPTGQVSWHIHDSERAWFNHLEVKENKWDGHNTQRKYERLQALSTLRGKALKQPNQSNQDRASE